MRHLVIAIITPVCRLGDWLITRYGSRLNGDDDAQ